MNNNNAKTNQQPPVVSNGRRQPVNRRLFEADPKAVEKELDQLEAQCQEEAQKKWNFDFVKEQPLDGDWVWEKVED